MLGLTLDLLTKAWAFNALVTGQFEGIDGRMQVSSEEYQFLPGFLHFRAHVNYGAVFGLGQGARPVFIGVSIVAMGLLVYLFATSGRQRLYQVLLGMLAAGVLGNFYDRALFGYVRDMIYSLPKWGIFPWIFNIADSLLCVGVAGMFLLSFLRGDDEKADLPAAGTTA
ncbi:MAG TPA: signal peptidase II [Tepidisphaeraceae bacterium]